MKLRKLLVLTAALSLTICSIPAYAATPVGNIILNIDPTDEGWIEEGTMYAEVDPYVQSGAISIEEWNTSNNERAPRKSYNYTMTLTPNAGFVFDDNTTVTVVGAHEITINSREANKMKITAKTYPVYALDNPTNIVIDTEAEKATWDKVEYAKKYGVIIYYTQNENERHTSKTVNSPSISLKDYIKWDDVHVSVRAMKGTDIADRYLANSYYVTEDGEIDTERSEEEDLYIDSLPVATTAANGVPPVTQQTGGSQPGPTGGSPNVSSEGPGSTYSGNWVGSGDTWYYQVNGVNQTGWIQDGVEPDGDTIWYYCGADGKMFTGGWQIVDGLWYYLNPFHDGTYGKMLSGYISVGDSIYYLNEVHDGTYGAMYANRQTPDGRWADANGIVR